MIASTQDQILRLLQVRGSATVAEVAEHLGVGLASVRRHLDHLRAEGLADVRLARHGVGRPSFVFYPTEEGEERAPTGYPQLLSRLYQGLRSLSQRQIDGRQGAQVLHTAFQAAAEQVAQEHRDEVAGDSLEDRVAQTGQALQSEGIVDNWAKRQDSYHLTNSACPYRQAATENSGPCELDRRAIELLVEAPVQQVSRIADGAPICEYIVAASGGGRQRGAPTA